MLDCDELVGLPTAGKTRDPDVLPEAGTREPDGVGPFTGNETRDPDGVGPLVDTAVKTREPDGVGPGLAGTDGLAAAGFAGAAVPAAGAERVVAAPADGAGRAVTAAGAAGFFAPPAGGLDGEGDAPFCGPAAIAPCSFTFRLAPSRGIFPLHRAAFET
jgi:hypothetical protein